MTPDPLEYLPWLTSRSAGIVAFALVSCSVVLGLLTAARLVPRRFVVRARGWHEQLAVVALGAVALHGAALLFDGWLDAAPLDLVVPFRMDQAPFWTGLGVLAAWLAVALGLTYYVRRRVGPRRWRLAHRATPVVWMLGALHALGAGTDAGTLWLRGLVIGSASLIVGLLVVRWWREPAPATVWARR